MRYFVYFAAFATFIIVVVYELIRINKIHYPKIRFQLCSGSYYLHNWTNKLQEIVCRWKEEFFVWGSRGFRSPSMGFFSISASNSVEYYSSIIPAVSRVCVNIAFVCVSIRYQQTYFKKLENGSSSDVTALTPKRKISRFQLKNCFAKNSGASKRKPIITGTSATHTVTSSCR